MKINQQCKNELLNYCKEILLEKSKLCKNALKDISEAIENETKSSAGDKFETSREMMQQEREKLNNQMNKISATMHILQSLTNKKCYRVETGALVKSNKENLLFIPGFSTLKFKEEKVHSVAIVSPIGQVLKGLKKSESASYNGKMYTIDKII